ncbi:hypothetical protein MLD38_001703 [Melastoma candidum]|uniref:Uncharacterized protein n=1 Tax=Melastoma candidum TaxID=119954 RepID=A0ACB9SHD5_9MYRT|nr:hypothetical protein MLD38_001703 [Melastoma candidum]
MQAENVDCHGIHGMTSNGRRAKASQGVKLHVQDKHVIVNNGILRVTISKPDGFITGVKYNGISNLLETRNEEYNRGYWDLVWSQAGSTGTTGISDNMKATSFRVVVENEEQVELSFVRQYDNSQEGKMVPLNIDMRFIMLRDCSGFYSYGIYEHLPEWPAFNLPQTRIVFRLRKDKFRYMAVSDDRQRYMPLPDDRLPGRGEPLAYPEAVLLVHPVEPEFKGEVDDKYQYSCENKDLNVHGWICSDPPTGFWQITPSNEFRSGGLLKQNLTSHVGPTTLAMLISAHYGGEDLVLKLQPGEPWKKMFGPVFFYVNSAAKGDELKSLWEDAKEQMTSEVHNWPYNFPASDDFEGSDQRGDVSGRLLVGDTYFADGLIPAKGAYVGLALPGESGSWQTEVKGYQFWTTTDLGGYFSINNVRTGNYNLYAFVPHFIGDYMFEDSISITSGCQINMGDIVYRPPRDGPTLWEIGMPDRTAMGFYIPDVDPRYSNPLCLNGPDRFRQYGLWERYADLYPDGDLVYTVGQSDYAKDWYFVQVNRKVSDGTYKGTTWQIKFEMDNVNQAATYKLRLALAAANVAQLEVRVNKQVTEPPLFATGVIGKDNAIARHGIHGLYRLFTVDIPGSRLAAGENTIYLSQTMSSTPLQGIMYDYIRLEGASS